MPGFIGVPELILLGVLALLLFGPKRLPEMGRGLGKGMREFKDSISGDGGSSHDIHSFDVASDTTATSTLPTGTTVPPAVTAAAHAVAVAPHSVAPDERTAA